MISEENKFSIITNDCAASVYGGESSLTGAKEGHVNFWREKCW